MKKIVFLTALAACAAAAPACAQPPAPAAPRVEFQRGHAARPVTRADVQARVQRLFARLDVNRDGFVSRDEIEAARTLRAGREGPRRFGAERGLRGDPAHRGERLFARLDGNHDGVITRAEFDAAMAARGQRLAARGPMEEGPRARFGRAGMGGFRGQAFERMDLNHDGRVSVEEATRFALQAFDRADANHDGVVTPEERRAARAARMGLRGRI
ncbi:MAG: EF-hand domain-containing protein [Alphaproteobacteria bacterium]|nr:EF-hand domain-containing protein [Alphaproteobacteria bacterium]